MKLDWRPNGHVDLFGWIYAFIFSCGDRWQYTVHITGASNRLHGVTEGYAEMDEAKEAAEKHIIEHITYIQKQLGSVLEVMNG